MRGKSDKLQELISTFHANIKAYKSASYDEANTRVDFIDKFFELLDWDVRNTQGFSEDFREVVREDKVYIAGKPKAPDYSFRQGGKRLFFVEAKKPMVDIKESLEPAFQLRRYAYTAKLPLSILTDFEEFAIYDTRIKPNQKDKASVARIFYCKYDEYLTPNKTDQASTNFEYIHSIFSKGDILKGSFKNFIDDTRRKSGTSEVDREFLKLIEGWRGDLAKNIALRNPDIDVYNLNTAIQKIIDRIIFIRIAEDRHMEEYGLLDAISKEKDIYQKLDAFFRKADEKYNSGLFMVFDWISNLVIDDKILSSIIYKLYPPECPYEFSVLPIEILGNIYEQFLGKTIRLTTGHQAKVEEKPEVRKAGGVYYTPQYIVDYIVENTVGELLRQSKQPDKIEKIRILDPACGSGSFLVGAFNYLLNFHIEYYSRPENVKKALKEGRIYQFSEDTFRLSIQEKQKILLNNIYGVDIDRQAVEVTKLSLLLKLMENEQVESAGKLFKHSDLKLLPDLSYNIRCGNSLIASDFYADKDLTLFGKEEMRKVNSFDWDKEFAEVFAAGGFDCVIGNPPYGASFLVEEEKYFRKRNDLFSKIKDYYICFIEKGFKLLTNNGKFSFIIPSAWIGGPNYKDFRTFLLTKQIEKLILLPYDVFSDAYIDTAIAVFSNNSAKNSKFVYTYIFGIKEKLNQIDIKKNQYDLINQKSWEKTESQKFILDSKALQLMETLWKNCSLTLNEIALMKRGVLFEKTLLTNSKETENHYPYFEGNIYRYYFNYVANQYVEFSDKMKERPKDFFWFEKERILLRRLVNRRLRLMSVIVKKTFITNKNLYSIIPKEKEINIYSLLIILNSKLISYLYLKQVTQARKDDFPQITINDILSLPFPQKNKVLAEQQRIEDFVKEMTSTQENYYNAKIESDKEIFQKKIDLLDKQIDGLVYELYGLTEEEIRIVEGG